MRLLHSAAVRFTSSSSLWTALNCTSSGVTAKCEQLFTISLLFCKPLLYLLPQRAFQPARQSLWTRRIRTARTRRRRAAGPCGEDVLLLLQLLYRDYDIYRFYVLSHPAACSLSGGLVSFTHIRIAFNQLISQTLFILYSKRSSQKCWGHPTQIHTISLRCIRIKTLGEIIKIRIIINITINIPLWIKALILYTISTLDQDN